jgi:REP element-mobilizing transposase RayT
MPRVLRPLGDGLVYHAINRGNNRAAEQTQKRYPFRLFGYCLMTNHFHLLLSPEPGQSISRIREKSVSVHFFLDLGQSRFLNLRACRVFLDRLKRRIQENGSAINSYHDTAMILS